MRRLGDQVGASRVDDLPGPGEHLSHRWLGPPVDLQPRYPLADGPGDGQVALDVAQADGGGDPQGPGRAAVRALDWNVLFILAKPELDEKFLAEAFKSGLVNLGGHRSVGGMRASIYNAMPQEGVDTLVKFMKEFEKRNA